MSAKEPDARSYETHWVVTQDVPSEYLTARSVARGTEIFRQKILFERLATADVALAEAANGEEFIPAGEQYYKSTTLGPELWCTANMKMPEGALMTSIMGRVYSQYCILDQDKDGVFDSFFKRARTIEALPTVRGKITPRPRPIRPLRLTEADPASLRTHYYIGLMFVRNVGKEGAQGPLFQRFAGSEHGRFEIEQAFSAPGGTDQAVVVEGARIAYSVSGKELDVRAVQPYAMKSIVLVGTECGMINGC